MDPLTDASQMLRAIMTGPAWRTIQADGVLMGCSTFGQVAGLLTEGIKLFSVGCVGHITPVQYRMIPPLAIAEYGHMWVPIDGSWRNPELTASRIFDAALTTHLKKALRA